MPMDAPLMTPMGTRASLRDLKDAGQAGVSVDEYVRRRELSPASSASPVAAPNPNPPASRADAARTHLVQQQKRRMARTLLTAAFEDDQPSTTQLLGS